MASRNVGLQKLTHPTPTGGGSSDRLAYRDIPAKTGGAEAPPSEPPKLEAKMMKPQILRENCGFRRRKGTRDANLGPARWRGLGEV